MKLNIDRVRGIKYIQKINKRFAFPLLQVIQSQKSKNASFKLRKKSRVVTVISDETEIYDKDI